MQQDSTPATDAASRDGSEFSEGLGPTPRERACTCHPSDNPPRPCPGMHALGACFQADNQRLRAALAKIADWDSNWGPFPENNEAWRAMVVVTAREAVPEGAGRRDGSPRTTS